MNPRRTSALRTRLRDINIEYSALVKSTTVEGRSVRMAQLRSERTVLMALLSEGGDLLRFVPAHTSQQPA
jgi:hypothetical protein